MTSTYKTLAEKISEIFNGKKAELPDPAKYTSVNAVVSADSVSPYNSNYLQQAQNQMQADVAARLAAMQAQLNNNVNHNGLAWQSADTVNSFSALNSLFQSGAQALVSPEDLLPFAKTWDCNKCTNSDQARITRKYATGKRVLTESERKFEEEQASSGSAGQYPSIPATKDIEYLEITCQCCGYKCKMCTADSEHNL